MSNRLARRTAKNSVHFTTLSQRAATEANASFATAATTIVNQSNTSVNVTSVDDKPLILSNDDKTATIEIKGNGEIHLNSGIIYKVVEDKSGVVNRNLNDNDFFITFSNSDTETVTLPSAADNTGQYYIIYRNYARITTGPRAEPLFGPPFALNIVATGNDSIDQPGTTSTGLFPFSRQKIISDGMSMWHLV